ncbi:hypothetical protein OF830_28660 [Bacillus paramycoides]|uniref:hypothetical protein n=1 Tax=Bacillus paramycoides TaxID=2026194 RepID=UPI0022430D76|nr:hypothetical protein [Bacillus paramycoides]
MNKLKWGSRVIFCFLAISACFILAIGITKGAFFAKDKVLDFFYQEVKVDVSSEDTIRKSKGNIEGSIRGEARESGDDSGGALAEIENPPDFNEEGFFKEGDGGKFPRDKKGQNDDAEFIGGSTENIFIQIGILFVVIVIIFFIFRRMRNKKQTIHHIHLKQKEVRKIGEDAEQEERDSLILPAEEVRAMLIKWELTLSKFEKRRLQETVQQWFSRIHKNSDIIPIYEKVRYGEGTASNEELQMMRKWIHENVKKSL